MLFKKDILLLKFPVTKCSQTLQKLHKTKIINFNFSKKKKKLKQNIQIQIR